MFIDLFEFSLLFKHLEAKREMPYFSRYSADSGYE